MLGAALHKGQTFSTVCVWRVPSKAPLRKPGPAVVLSSASETYGGEGLERELTV